MRNRRSIMWLFVMLVFTLAVHAILTYRGDVSTALVQRTELAGAEFTSPSRVTVALASSPAAVLEPGKGWRLVAPYSALADERAVMKLIDSVVTGDIRDTLGDGDLLKLGRTRDDFGLANPRVTLTLEAGAAKEEISFGIATPARDGVYAAVAGENAVYVVDSRVYDAVALSPEAFRRRALFAGSTPSVLSFDLKRGAGSFLRFVKDGERWSLREPRAAAANDSKIRELLEGVLTASAVDFVWPVGVTNEPPALSVSRLALYGLDPESAVTLTMRANDSLDRRIVFGKAEREGRVYALVHDAGAIVTVDGALKDAALASVEEFTDSRLFIVDPAQVTRVSIADGGATYLLARDSGSAWRLDAPVSAATDPASVDAFLVRLFALGNNDLVEGGVAVSVSTSAPPVSVSRDALLGSFRLEDLRSHEIVRIDPATVKRISVARGGAKATSAVYDRDRRAWNVEAAEAGGTVSRDAVDAMLAAFNPLAAEAIEKLKVTAADLRAYSLETPELTVAIDQDREDSIRKNLLIGKRAPGGGRYATIGATEAVFILSDAAAAVFETPLVITD